MSHKRQQNIFVDILAVLLKTIWAFIKLPYYFWTKDDVKKNLGPIRLDSALVSKQWGEIENMMVQGGPVNFRHAVTEADKLFDYVLKSKVSGGENFADRLKLAEKLMQPAAYDMVWRAHKVRNKLVHEVEAEVMSWEARDAIAGYKLGLRDFKLM